MNTIQRHEFEIMLKKLNIAERTVNDIKVPEKIQTSRLTLKDCDLNLVSKFLIRNSESHASHRCGRKEKSK